MKVRTSPWGRECRVREDERAQYGYGTRGVRCPTGGDDRGAMGL